MWWCNSLVVLSLCSVWTGLSATNTSSSEKFTTTIVTLISSVNLVSTTMSSSTTSTCLQTSTTPTSDTQSDTQVLMLHIFICTTVLFCFLSTVFGACLCFILCQGHLVSKYRSSSVVSAAIGMQPNWMSVSKPLALQEDSEDVPDGAMLHEPSADTFRHDPPLQIVYEDLDDYSPMTERSDRILPLTNSDEEKAEFASSNISNNISNPIYMYVSTHHSFNDIEPRSMVTQVEDMTQQKHDEQFDATGPRLPPLPKMKKIRSESNMRMPPYPETLKTRRSESDIKVTTLPNLHKALPEPFNIMPMHHNNSNNSSQKSDDNIDDVNVFNEQNPLPISSPETKPKPKYGEAAVSSSPVSQTGMFHLDFNLKTALDEPEYYQIPRSVDDQSPMEELYKQLEPKTFDYSGEYAVPVREYHSLPSQKHGTVFYSSNTLS